MSARQARIAELEQKLSSAEATMARIKKELHALRCDEAGVKAGDIVRRHRNGNRYKIVDVSFIGGPGPIIHGFKEKKDGSFSTRRTYVGWQFEKCP